MTMTIPPFMSKKEWDELINTKQPIDLPVFDGEKQIDPYTGLEAEPTTTFSCPHVFVLSAQHPLGNPYWGAAANNYERAWGLFQHYHRIFSGMGEEARKLINTLASTADQLISEAEKDQQVQNFTVVALTEDEAKIIRGMMDWALTIVPPSKGTQKQQLLTKNDRLPPATKALEALEKLAPEMWRQNLSINRENGPEAVRAVALIPAKGTELAIAHIAARQAKDIIYLIPDNWSLQKALRKELGDDAYNARVVTSETAEKLQANINIPALQGLKGAEFVKAYREAVEILIRHADRVVVGYNNDIRDLATIATAEAARRGKLSAAITPQKKILSHSMIDRLAEQAMRASPSRAEYARARTLGLHDIPVNSPEGRLALSLLEQAGGRKIPPAVIAEIAKTKLTINDLADMAKNRDTARELVHKYNIPIGVVGALANEAAMSAARESLRTILEDLRKDNVKIIGPEEFPGGLRNHKDAPPVLFAQGNINLLSSDLPIIGILGDHNLIPSIAQRAEAFLRGIEQAGGIPMMVEGLGVPPLTPQKPHIMVLATGHGHYGKLPTLEWKHAGKKDVLVAETPYRRYTIEIVDNKEERAILYTIERLDAQDGDHKRTTKIPLRGERPQLSHSEESNDETKEAAKFLADIRRVQKMAQVNEEFVRFGAVRARRQAILEAGGVIISALPPRREEIAFDPSTQSIDGLPTDRRPENEHLAVEMVAHSAHIITITQAAENSPTRHAVAISASRGRKVAVLPPAPEFQLKEEVAGNQILLSTPAALLPSNRFLSGTMGLAVAKAFGRDKAGVSTGLDETKAAYILVEKAKTIEEEVMLSQMKKNLKIQDNQEAQAIP